MTLEIDKDEKKLLNKQLKDEDLNEYKNIKNIKADSRTTIDSSVIF